MGSIFKDPNDEINKQAYWLIPTILELLVLIPSSKSPGIHACLVFILWYDGEGVRNWKMCNNHLLRLSRVTMQLSEGPLLKFPWKLHSYLPSVRDRGGWNWYDPSFAFAGEFYSSRKLQFLDVERDPETGRLQVGGAPLLFERFTTIENDIIAMLTSMPFDTNGCNHSYFHVIAITVTAPFTVKMASQLASQIWRCLLV